LALAELVLRFNAPFILFAPTQQHFDAHAQELLARVRAAFFTLQSTVVITDQGTFKPTKPPAELFAQFNPQPPPPERSAVPTRRETLSSQPRYALRKGLGVWHLIFDGKEAFIRHERGLFYVAWLLYHPDETPIHALDLAAKIPEIYRNQLGLPQLTDPGTGKVAPLLSGARIQERSLALDDAQSMRALFKKQKELEAILDSEDESEPVKAEALRELEALIEFQRQHTSRSKDNAHRTVHTVRVAIKRFHKNLLTSLDPSGDPHPLLRIFADHLQEHILAPSARSPGSFTCHPAPRLSWVP
jgi:hypothetical protein